MPSSDTTVKFKADISQLKSQMQAAQRQVKLVNSEFKAATAGLDDWSKSEEGLAAKIKQLNGVLDAQKKKLALMNEEYEKTVAVYGEQSAAADRVRIKINEQTAAIAKTESDIKKYNQALEELPETMDDAGNAAEKAADGFSVMKGALANLVADGVRAAISGLKDLAKQTFDVGSSFESAMSQVGAVSGANAEEIKKLTEKAEEMGAKTKFSATESAEAFNYMAMAGWKTKDMLGGIEGIMNLAAASGADLATASDIVTDALTAMGYSAQDAGKLADVMAAASSNANTNVEMMGSTFQYAAPIVGALGYSMEDTAVAIGLMANAGIKADKAGTALRSVLTRLSAPPKECASEMERLGISMTDSEGNMKSLQTIMIELRGAFSKLSETEQTAAAKHIAGAEAMSGLLAIVNAADYDFQKLTVAVNESEGAAAKMAETMQDNVGGKLTLLKSKIEGIMIKLFKKASDQMKDGIDTVGEALDQVDWDKVGNDIGVFATKAAELFKYLITNSSTIISVLKTIGTILGTVFISNKIAGASSAIIGLVNAFIKAKSATEALSTATSLLGLNMYALPIMAVVASVGILYAQTMKQKKAMEETAQAAYGLTDKQKELASAIDESAEAIKSANEARKETGQDIDFEYDKISSLKDKYNELIDENGNVKKGYEDLANELLGDLANGLGTTIDNIKENIDLNGKLGESIDDLINKKKNEAKLAAFESSYNDALKNELQYFQELKGAKNEQAEAQDKLTKAQNEYNEALDTWNNNLNPWAEAELSKQFTQASENLKTAQATFDETSGKVKEAQANWGTAQSTIESYQSALAASTEGNAQKMNDALLSMQYGLVNHTTASKEQLEQQYINTKTELEDIKELYKNGKISDDVVADYQRINELAGAELDKWVAKNGEAGGQSVKNFTGTASQALSGAYDAARQLGSGSSDALYNSLGDWGKYAEDKTGDYLGVLEGSKGEANKTAGDLGQAAADGIKEKSSEFKAAAEDSSKEFNGTIEGLSGEFKKSGNSIADFTGLGIQSNSEPIITAGNWTTTSFADAVKDKSGEAKTAGESIASEAAKGADSKKTDAETSGSNFSQGFINGIGSLIDSAWNKAKELAKSAWNGLKKGQEEGSPSKLTTKSGEFFGQGYINGINAMKKAVYQAAGGVAKGAVNELKKAQQEGSPSKLTYESGKNFTLGFINGIASLESKLVSTAKGLVNKTLAELLKLKDFNFSEVTENASNAFASGFSKQLNYMIDRINYQNQQQLKDFDNTIAQLQQASANEVAAAQEASQKKQDKLQKKIEKKQAKKQTASTKKQIKKLQNQIKSEQKALEDATDKLEKSYDAQIEEQQKMKEAYQQASSSMISEFTTAMNEYQTQAQKLIDDTMNGIANTYQSQYDALINKQDNLISKLKSAGDLFNVSGAGVMTINDIQAQTAAIKQYASKLATIKKRVSSDLFDQIASYDMKEGEAFIDRLLAMTDKELQAYSDAYDEKMSLSESLSQNIYKSDFDKVAKDYKNAMQQAFKDLPKQLEDLGWQTMKGFLSGLTTNTDYMEASVKTFISGMVDTFKKQLGIRSPSRVAMALGELTGEGFADGLLEMVKTVKEAAKEITDTVASSLDFSDSMSSAKGAIYQASGAAGVNRNAGSFAGTNTQIINFNQTNNSPKALDRLTIYRQTNNMLFSAKVGLSNV